MTAALDLPRTWPPKRLDELGRCCGRKPMVYKRPHRLFCARCCCQFDPETRNQTDNWAWRATGDGLFRPLHITGDYVAHRMKVAPK